MEVVKVGDVAGPAARSACGSDAPLVLLENLRFEPGEEANDPGFAGELASLADAYVDDAFGATHRATRVGGGGGRAAAARRRSALDGRGGKTRSAADGPRASLRRSAGRSQGVR